MRPSFSVLKFYLSGNLATTVDLTFTISTTNADAAFTNNREDCITVGVF